MKRGKTRRNGGSGKTKAARGPRASARPAKATAQAKAAARHRAAPRLRRRPASPRAQARTGAAAGALQSAAASLTDGEVVEILADLSWPSRAKWLSSYFADQLPDDVMADHDGLADSLDEIGAQIAALLPAMDAERPSDFLGAVTCCFSSDPSHVAAGLSWLQDNMGTRRIDLDALADLPGYRAIAEIIERVRA